MTLSREISQHLIETWSHGLEVSLWLEKEKDEKRNILSLKCKACIKSEGQINSMSMLKKTLIES